MTGKAIKTLGYRGMHSFEMSYTDFFVPEENLIGGDTGLTEVLLHDERIPKRETSDSRKSMRPYALGL